MHKEILEITPAGGIYCLVDLKKAAAWPPVFQCAKPNGYAIQDILQQIRFEEAPGDAFLTDGDILSWAAGCLCETALGRALSFDARYDGWMIAVEDGDEFSAKACLDPEFKCLYLPRYAESVTVFSRSQEAQMRFLFELVKGLRLIWQENAAAIQADLLTAEEFIRFERLIDADGDLCALLAAYQLRGKGDRDLWRYILSSDMHDIAMTLCECLDFDSSADGVIETLGFVFQDWFADDARLARADHAGLSKLDARNDKEFGPEDVSFEDLIRLSMMPDGFSYLEYVAAEILSDAFYTRVPDPIHQAHLKQIVQESRLHMIEEIGFRDADLARKFFPHSTFETIV